MSNPADPAPVPAASSPSPSVSPADGAPSVLTPGLGLLVAAGLVAGLASWLLINQFGSAFRQPAWVTAGIGSSPTPEQQVNINRYEKLNGRQNWSLRFGIVGAALGALLSLAGRMASGTVKDKVAGALTGLIIGALGGAIGGLAAAVVGELLPTDQAISEWPDSYRSLGPTGKIMANHMVGFALAGASAALGAALAIGRRDLLVKAVGSGLCAGLIGGLLFSPLCAMIFSSAEENVYPKTADVRLLWVGLASVLIAYAIAHAMQPVRKKA